MNFSLTPFSAHDSPQITISGAVHRKKSIFTVSYAVAGNIEEIFFPSPTANPTRKDGLWRTTCFEFFLAVTDSPQYWEFNLSPSGEWNVYVIDAYRQVNMREETRIQRLEFNFKKEAECFSLESEVDLSPIIAEESLIKAGITSVIQANNRKESYWALTHPYIEADFHLRNSFILEFA